MVALFDDRGWHLRGDGDGGRRSLGDLDNQIVDVRMQDSKRKNRGKDLAGNHPAIRHVGTQCSRAKRTLSSSTQTTMEIDALFDGTDFPLAFSKAWFNELNMDYFRNSHGTR